MSPQLSWVGHSSLETFDVLSLSPVFLVWPRVLFVEALPCELEVALVE